MTNNDLIIYLDIDDDDMYSGMDAMSFVDKPATQLSWNRFEDDTKYKFELEEDKRIITGPAMIAETPIKRYSKQFGIYYVKFSESTVLKMMKKYFMENKIHNLNEQHNSKKVIKDVYLIESFIVSDNVKSNLYPDIEKGSWITSYFVKDKKYWNETIKSDKFTGFSLEGKFIENYEMGLITKNFNEIKDISLSNMSDKEMEKIIKKKLEIYK